MAWRRKENSRRVVRLRRQAHAKTRAMERYGISLTAEAQASIVKSIQQNEAEFARRLSNTRTAWLVETSGQKVVVIYSNVTKSIVTVMHKHWAEKER